MERQVFELQANNNRAPDRDKKNGVNRDENCCPKCGAPLDNLDNNDEPAVYEDIFPEDDFICPACCCGIYIEVREE